MAAQRDQRQSAVLEMVDRDLIERVRTGAYVVDPHAVAGAIIGRRLEARQISRMLIAPQLDRSPGRVAEGGAASGADVS
jgi:hypothetical protein